VRPHIVGLAAYTVTYFGHPWSPSAEVVNLSAAGTAAFITIYFWWPNTKGIHESSDDALKIMLRDDGDGRPADRLVRRDDPDEAVDAASSSGARRRQPGLHRRRGRMDAGADSGVAPRGGGRRLAGAERNGVVDVRREGAVAFRVRAERRRVAGPRGNTYTLGEAYAFGVIWSFAFQGLAMLVLRLRDSSHREWKVPFNVRLDGYEIPGG
jgi:hypothetical protein